MSDDTIFTGGSGAGGRGALPSGLPPSPAPGPGPDREDPGPGDDPRPAEVIDRDRSGGQIINVKSPDEAEGAVDELIDHRKHRRGKVIGLAGLPRHGKSEFAKQLREALSRGVTRVEDYSRTYSGSVNIYYLPKSHRRDALVDLAGEDFASFGNPDLPMSRLPVMAHLLWPLLEHLDGIVLFVNLPLLWSPWNGSSGDDLVPSEAEANATQDLADRMVQSVQTLLKYLIVAKNLKKLAKAGKAAGLQAPAGYTGHWIPERHAVNDAFVQADRLDIPVFIAFSKADLYEPTGRPLGLRTPPLAVSRGRRAETRIRPEHHDPMVLGKLAFPGLFKFLREHVRYFKFDFVQVVHDESPNPDPEGVADVERRTAKPEPRGAFSALEFLTEHPWWFPTPSTASLLEVERRRDPSRWSKAVRAFTGTGVPASADDASDDPAPDWMQ